MPRFTLDDARRVYDRLGAKQDSQAFYEQPAIDILLRDGEWSQARRVFEFGCGTGRVAHLLLDAQLKGGASYTALDLSPRMVALAQARLRPWTDRARIAQYDGVSTLPFADAAFDRVVSTYVFDLLEPDHIRDILAEARRILAPHGLLCIAGLTHSAGPISGLISRGWGLIRSLRPSLVGGCRPLDMAPYLAPAQWRVLTNETVTPYAIASQALVARRL